MGQTYTAFRSQGLPTYYPSNKTAVTVDVLEVGFIFAFVILFFSFLVILPGIRGWQRCFSLIRIVVSLFVGAGIMLSLWGQEWEKAELHDVKTFYKAFSTEEITADIEVKIGLNSVNITLKAPDGSLEEHPSEIINYNERFNFYGGQGRNGFGRFSGRINREFREAQWSGKPYPILWIAEYFTLDGELIRWGRSYRHGGYYTYIMVWLAFPLWLLSNILFFMVIRNGAYFLIMTGGCMLTANVLYSTIRYGSQPMKIPFGADHILEFVHGPSFWLCMVTGLIAVVCGVVVLIMDLFKPIETATFFNIDPLQDFEDTFLFDQKQGMDGDTFESGKANGEGGETSNRPASEQGQVRGRFEYRSRFQSRFAKSRRIPRPKSTLVEEVLEEDGGQEPGPTNRKTSAPPENPGDIPLRTLDDTPKSPNTDTSTTE